MSNSVAESARAFDAELHSADYAATHADSEQLERLIELLDPQRDRCYLDLGTGAGYVSTQLAERFRTTQVIGADIAENALKENARIARQKSYCNLHFLETDGITLPFRNKSFAGVISRYAFHHFPEPGTSMSEVVRVLHNSGRLVLSDAVRHASDSFEFINKFQLLKQDGHIEMLGEESLKTFLRQCGFKLLTAFESSLSFERTSNQEYESLIDATPADILDAYQLSVVGSQIKLTFPIFNAVFAPY